MTKHFPLEMDLLLGDCNSSRSTPWKAFLVPKVWDLLILVWGSMTGQPPY